MVPKPGKNPNEVSSYRPISLLPILSKILEKLILTKLTNETKLHGLDTMAPIWISQKSLIHTTVSSVGGHNQQSTRRQKLLPSGIFGR
jgi:delta-aminolevulinic acid dehydratase/porphobilinogen synthase